MDARVAIVGAGPAGALLAYLLGSRGIETLLIERQSDFEREFRGEVLMPSGIRALEAAGFDLDQLASRTPREVNAFMNGKRFLSFRPGELAGGEPGQPPDRPLPTAFSQPELLEALVARAISTKHVDFRRGATLRRIDLETNGARLLHLRSETSIAGDDNATLRVPYLIGADGRGSVCRRSLDPRVRSRGAPLDVVWFKMPYPKDWHEPVARIEVGRGRLMIVLPSADGLLQIAWVIVKGTYGDLKSRSVAEWAEKMSAYVDPEFAAHLHTHRDALSRPFLLRAVADRVEGWASPGALLIGDAAHTMSPVGGQGLNLALRDAIVTANELVPVLETDGDLDRAAARIEGLRAPEIDKIQRLAALPPKLVLGRTPLHEGIRRLIARLAEGALARGRGAETASLFLDGVTQVELRV